MYWSATPSTEAASERRATAIIPFSATNRWSDTLAWIKGNHYWRFGVDTNWIQNAVIWPGFTPMRIILPNVNCLVDFANFVNPTAGVASVPADGPCPTAEITPQTNFGFPTSPFGPNPND